MKTKIMLAILALGASAFIASAQDTNAVPDGPGPGRPPPSFRWIH